MIWLTWRQLRTQAMVAAVFLGVLAVALVVTGLRLAHIYDTSGVATCQANCQAVADAFLREARNGVTGVLFTLLSGAGYVVPAVIGVFWGAPLIARELEAGTHRLVWNQSVTRSRWVATKLLGVGLASIVVTALLSLAVTWWADPIDRIGPHRVTPDIFASRGIVPIGYAAFAFALGAAAGVLVRRTVPAMAITLAVVIAAVVAAPLVIRPHLMTPVRVSVPLTVDNIRGLVMSDQGREMFVEVQADVPGVWILSNTVVRSDGRPFTGPANMTACNRDAPAKDCMQWIASLHLRQSLSYHPATRFWALQWREMSLYLGVAALLALFSYWWVSRRRS
ncbi:MAG TPA: ABC transporter permease subunit [Rugosimonospora sp.]|nr:ABC transporter permease subunit [Rugosimonospora sp.]